MPPSKAKRGVNSLLPMDRQVFRKAGPHHVQWWLCMTNTIIPNDSSFFHLCPSFIHWVLYHIWYRITLCSVWITCPGCVSLNPVGLQHKLLHRLIPAQGQEGTLHSLMLNFLRFPLVHFSKLSKVFWIAAYWICCTDQSSQGFISAKFLSVPSTS